MIATTTGSAPSAAPAFPSLPGTRYKLPFRARSRRFAGRVTNIGHYRDDDATSFTAYAYSYDRADRIVAQTTTHDNSIGAFSSLPPSVTEDFEFDLAGQLTESDSTVNAQDESFEYDQNGNRMGATAGSSSRDYDTGEYNRLTDDDTYTYEYDDEGNRTRRTEKGGFGGNSYSTYVYDHRNRLVTVQNYDVTGAPQTRIDYRYDADNRLVLREREELGTGPFPDPTSEEDFIYAGDQRVLAFDGETDQLAHRYTWGPGRDQLLTDEVFDSSGALDETLWAASDHLGSVNDLLDSTEAIVEHREYDSFGALDAAYNEMGNPVTAANLKSDVGYTGKFFGAATGLQNNNARWYDPATCRFISEDPLGFGDGPNPFMYGDNDPINKYDPTGTTAQGNPLNNLYSGLGSLGPSYSAQQLFGGPVSNNRTSASPINSIYNLGPSYNPVNTGYSAPKSGGSNSSAFNLGPVATSVAKSAIETFNPLGTAAAKTGVGQQYDTNAALNHQQQATNPNRTLRAGDIGTVLGGNSQYAATGQGVATIKEFGRETTQNIILEGVTAGAGGLFGKLDDVNDLRKAGNAATHGHHPLPKFLGGNPGQVLSKVEPTVHREFHSLLNQNLKKAGIPLNVGGKGGSALNWSNYLNQNPGAQQKAFDAVLDASRVIDVKHGTNVTQGVWQNVYQGNFRPHP